MIESSSQSIYDNSAPVFAKRWETVHRIGAEVDRQHFWYVIRNERIYAMLRAFEPDLRRKSMLELGCGNGNVIGYLWEHGLTNCSGWDLNSYALDLARQRYPSITFQEKNFLEEKPESRYEILGLFDLLEHLPNDVNVLKVIRRLVKPRGRIILTVPAHQWLWSAYDDFYGHIRRYSKSQMVSALEQAGYSNIHCFHFMSALVPFILFSRKQISKTVINFDSEMNERFSRDSGLPPSLINTLAKFILRLEQNLFVLQSIEFGSSIIATATA